MRTLEDYQFDRCKVEVWQHMEPKHTNSPIAFLCSYFVNIITCDDAQNEIDLTSNWCILMYQRRQLYKKTTCQIPCERIGHRNSYCAPGKRAARASEFISAHGAMIKNVCFVFIKRSRCFGAHGDEEIPVPIPNTEVKLISGDYTAKSGKLARCRII